MRLPLTKLIRMAVAGAAALAVLGYGGNYGWHWWTLGRFQETTDDAYVRADATLVAARVAGYVASVEVGDNQPVTAGQVLFRIDDADYKARVEQARAEVEARRAALAAAKTQQELQRSVIAQAEADVQAATAESERTGTDFGRYTQLAAKDAASVQKLDSARTDATKAKATLASSKAKLTAERDRVSLLAAQEAGAEAALNQAKAALQLAEIDLENTVVRAAVSGIVGNWQVRVGRYVQPATQLLAIVPLADAYVVANYKETQLDHMQAGQRVDMAVDSFPGRTVTGHIGSLSPASGAQFALLPPDNATGNFTKVVQRVPVRIHLRDVPDSVVLRPGMSVALTVDTRK